MKLSKLYTNKPDLFEPISFEDGLNVVLAEIRLPENLKKDTHNLGKTTLGRLLDFCFLSKRDPSFFLFKHFDRFKEFVFYLEIELANGSYLTVRRSVASHTKIDFKKHAAHHQDWTKLEQSQWDHTKISFEKSQKLLDSLLDWRGLNHWSYRNALGYLLRSQDDYGDIAHLNKFKGGHSQWKPFLAHLLGFNAKLISRYYEKEKAVEQSTAEYETVEKELGGTVKEISKIDGLLLLKQQDLGKKQKFLDTFDFRSQDQNITREVVDQIDEKIATLNSKRYSLSFSKKKIQTTLEEDQIMFDTAEAELLFKQAGVAFQGQIKKDFNQLIAFNQAITSERRSYLQEEYAEIDVELKQINEELNRLGKQRSDSLSFLGDTDIYNKHRQVSAELVELKADIESLERQRVFLRRLQELRTKIRKQSEERDALQVQIEDDVELQNADQNSKFSKMRLFFNETVEAVISQHALLSVYSNKKGHLEFRAEILDKSNNATSADRGHSYRKLLCIAFDLAVLRVHLGDAFPRFVFHDGVFESLDDRKKGNLLKVLRQHSKPGIQTIITLIHSDMPPPEHGSEPVFSDSEVVVNLHDENETGLLFKMKPW